MLIRLLSMVTVGTIWFALFPWAESGVRVQSMDCRILDGVSSIQTAGHTACPKRSRFLIKTPSKEKEGNDVSINKPP